MKLQLLDVRHDEGDPGRLIAELELKPEGVHITILSEDARPMLEHGLVRGIPINSEGGRFCTPDEGEPFLRAVEERYGRSTYYRTVRVED